MNNQNNMFVICLPYKKSRKNINWELICQDEFWKYFFWCTPIFIGNIIYFAKIVRALSSNKIVFFTFLHKVNNSIATKLCVELINNCAQFLKKNSTRHNSMTKLCSAFFKYENKEKEIEKSNAQFWSALKWERV